MKDVFRITALIVGFVIANIAGWGLLILTVANLAWMLFKDTTLLSWWWIGFLFSALIISVVVMFLSFIFLRD